MFYSCHKRFVNWPFDLVVQTSLMLIGRPYMVDQSESRNILTSRTCFSGNNRVLPLGSQGNFMPKTTNVHYSSYLMPFCDNWLASTSCTSSSPNLHHRPLWQLCIYDLYYLLSSVSDIILIRGWLYKAWIMLSTR